MKRKYEVIGIVIDTEKEAEKCSFLSAVLDCKIENFAKITDFFLGGGDCLWIFAIRLQVNALQ